MREEATDESAAPATPPSTAKRPQDMLADCEDAATVGGVEIRKGTLGAFIANARRLNELSPDVGEHADERGEILEQLRRQAPAVRAIGLLEVFAPRSAVLAAILTDSEDAR